MTPEDQERFDRAYAKTMEYQWRELAKAMRVLILEIAKGMGVFRMLDWISAALAKREIR